MAGPSFARRHRRYVRHRTVRHVVRKTAPAPTIAPARNVILMVAYGYDDADWASARASRPDGFVPWDRMPVTGVALTPPGAPINAATAAGLIAAGTAGPAAPQTVFELGKRTGRSIAIVTSGAITDPLPSRIAVAGAAGTPGETLRRLTDRRFDALFARSVPDFPTTGTDTSGYRMLTEPSAILTAEIPPVLAIATADAIPLDAMAFRALHLAARNTKGFLMAVASVKDTGKAEEFGAAVATALSYARRDGHTLVLVLLCSDRGASALYSEGIYAAKFTGTIMLSDVPKIVAGVAAVKGVGRDFSPLYASRLAGQGPPERGTGVVPLPW